MEELSAETKGAALLASRCYSYREGGTGVERLNNYYFEEKMKEPLYVTAHSEECDADHEKRIQCIAGGISRRDTARIFLNGRKVKTVLPWCRGHCSGWGVSQGDIAEAVAEDLGFELLWETHQSHGVSHFNLRSGCKPFSPYNLWEKGIRPLVATKNSSYWLLKEVHQFSEHWNKQEIRAIARPEFKPTCLFVSQDAYIFDWSGPLPGFPLGVIKQGISINPYVRIKAVGKNLPGLQVKSVVPKGGRKLEQTFQTEFSRHRIDSETARKLGLINPTEWYDGLGRIEMLEFFDACKKVVDFPA